MDRYRASRRSTGAAVLVLAFTGCFGSGVETPDLAPVTGKVTMGGQPLAGANVTFEPQSEGGPSGGMTDDQGQFELYYGADNKGAVPGTHVVRISKIEGEAGDELIPEKYNVQSDLTAEVKPDGPNEFTFDLEQ